MATHGNISVIFLLPIIKQGETIHTMNDTGGHAI
jgi:hypothetical protein